MSTKKKTAKGKCPKCGTKNPKMSWKDVYFCVNKACGEMLLAVKEGK